MPTWIPEKTIMRDSTCWNSQLPYYDDRNDRKQVDFILLDFSKAFDKVCHRKLLLKLKKLWHLNQAS